MAALIRQANKRIRNGQQAKDKRNERTHSEKEGEKREKTTPLSEKKVEASNVSEQREKGWIYVIRVHDATHLAVTTTRQGNRHSRTTPHKETMICLVRHRDYPRRVRRVVSMYIVNEQYNSRNKRASQEKKQ